jgi:hypothetical protein
VKFEGALAAVSVLGELSDHEGRVFDNLTLDDFAAGDRETIAVTVAGQITRSEAQRTSITQHDDSQTRLSVHMMDWRGGLSFCEHHVGVVMRTRRKNALARPQLNRAVNLTMTDTADPSDALARLFA